MMEREARQEGKIKKGGLFLLLTIIILIIICSSCYLIYSVTDPEKLVDDWDRIKLKQERIEDGWLITFKHVHKAWTERNSGFEITDVVYFLDNSGAGQLQSIDGKFNGNGTVIFFDKNDNFKMDIEDVFLIYDNPRGDVRSGYTFGVMVNTACDTIELK